MIHFVRNLAFLSILGIGLFIVAPDIMNQVVAVFGGLGLMPFIIILILVAALPRRARRRTRRW